MDEKKELSAAIYALLILVVMIPIAITMVRVSQQSAEDTKCDLQLYLESFMKEGASKSFFKETFISNFRSACKAKNTVLKLDDFSSKSKFGLSYGIHDYITDSILDCKTQRAKNFTIKPFSDDSEVYCNIYETISFDDDIQDILPYAEHYTQFLASTECGSTSCIEAISGASYDDDQLREILSGSVNDRIDLSKDYKIVYMVSYENTFAKHFFSWTTYLAYGPILGIFTSKIGYAFGKSFENSHHRIVLVPADEFPTIGCTRIV